MLQEVLLQQGGTVAPANPESLGCTQPHRHSPSMGCLRGQHSCLCLQDTSMPAARKACPSCTLHGGWLSRPEVPAPHPLLVQSHCPSSQGSSRCRPLSKRVVESAGGLFFGGKEERPLLQGRSPQGCGGFGCLARLWVIRPVILTTWVIRPVISP